MILLFRKIFIRQVRHGSFLLFALLWPWLLFLLKVPVVTVNYLGHASFIISFDNEISVLADYGKANAYESYGWSSPIESIGDRRPDIITYSHFHDDHFDTTRVDLDGVEIYNGGSDYVYGKLRISTIESSETDISIRDNKSYLFEYRGIKVLHLGDCQADIISLGTDSVKNSIFDNLPKKADIIIFPIEGSTKFPEEAALLIKKTNSKVYIPMHFWSEEYKEDFLNNLRSKSDIRGKKVVICETGKGGYYYKKYKNYNSVSIIDMERSVE